MQIDALEFHMLKADLVAEPFVLDAKTLKNLQGSRRSTPRLIMLSDIYTEILLNTPQSIEFLGEKHSRRSIGSYFSGPFDRLPLLVADNYTSAGRLRQGVRAFFRQLKHRGESGVYLLAVRSLLFGNLRSEPRLAQDGPGNQTAASVTTSVERYLERLPKVEIPRELRKRYIGNSSQSELVRRQVMLAAHNVKPVMILGPTGTGKSTIAREIHRYSDRSDSPFVSVNCGAIPSELIESELFGHVKGAFTGALKDKKGLWAQGHRGTLFLDEIGDLSKAHQVKILKALQEGVIRPVGATEEKKVDVRIIAATNLDLYKMVQQRRFREDLYYRLYHTMVKCSALRERPEDIPPLAEKLWSITIRSKRGVLSDEILSIISSYHWPGNVRQLKSILSALYNEFGRTDPEVTDLLLLLQRDGARLDGLAGVTHLRSASLVRQGYIAHLKRAADVVHACAKAVKSTSDLDAATFGPEHELAEELLNRCIFELDILCSRPMEFYDEESLLQLTQLTSALTEYRESLEPESVAPEDFDARDVEVAVRTASSTIGKTLKDLAIPDS